MSNYYRIASRADLPCQMQGIFLYVDAYQLCARWNRRHEAEDMAWPEAMEDDEEARELKLYQGLFSADELQRIIRSLTAWIRERLAASGRPAGRSLRFASR